MKIYLTSRGRTQKTVRDIASLLEEEGHKITSTWIYLDIYSEIDRYEGAKKDLQEIDSSDAVLIYSFDCERTPGGMWFEAGYALGKGKKVYLLGPCINIFCNLLKPADNISNRLLKYKEEQNNEMPKL